MIRKPAVAGTFYEGDPESLKRRIEWCFTHPLGPGHIPESIGNKRDIKGLMAPHAGYIYSGPIAAHSYARLVEDGFPETFLILCPNHTGMGSGVSLASDEYWETPLGKVKIDQEFAQELLVNTTILDSEPSAHLQEHSCEVQIPFLQYLAQIGGKDFTIVPICMWMQDLETATEVGTSIETIRARLDRDAVVIASTDFTHYQPQEIAYEKDKQVLKAIRMLDEKLMVERVNQLQVTMCGYGPVASTLVSCKKRSAEKAEILKYATSGDITGDTSAVVGYGSAVFL